MNEWVMKSFECMLCRYKFLGKGVEGGGWWGNLGFASKSNNYYCICMYCTVRGYGCGHRKGSGTRYEYRERHDV